VTPVSRPEIVRRQRGDSEAPLKIVVTGPFSAGKTTFIKTITPEGFMGTDRAVTDDSRSRKEQTTVAMDFGKLVFDDEATLQLVGTPGQDRFDVMWEILSRGMIGFVLLVDPYAPGGLVEAAALLARFRGFRPVPYVVGVTHLDTSVPPGSVLRVRQELQIPAGVPVGPCDPRNREQVKTALLQLLGLILDEAEDASAATG
jgi:signal recognition particle receptor subunit beta